MKLDRVGRRYGLRGPWVLREVGLALPAGALVRITGTNGTGKSTLLRLLAGIDAPTQGRITGRPRRTAYVPERFPAALPFTASGYLVHLGRVQGLGREEAEARAGEWLERFGAGDFAGTPLAELSKGSSQKVAVAQALLARPDLLVLDEAWTGLDTGARQELDRAVRERVASGGTVVFVDHDPRRLAGEADAEFTVEAGRVRPGISRVDGGVRPGSSGVDGGMRSGSPRLDGSVRPGEPRRDESVRSRVRIVVSGGTVLPDELPESSSCEPGPDGTTTVTVDAAHSDGLLRALLDASWHIHELSTESVRV
ncbi:ATP-binding cassette domain-containing protein [Streptomyces sp. NPDC059875]|uniref:ATP-binding cassette domain-containing protein n=1 Tax=unclassified Streptomyces TaxID=2593676 RepID=UPI0036547F0E